MYNITQDTIAEMPANEGYINNIHTMQISTCHRFESMCLDTRETQLTFTNTEHLIRPNIFITFQPDYYEKKRFSIKNLPTELPDKEVQTFLSEYATQNGKTYRPGIKHQNEYTTGTRVYQYTHLKEHIPKHIYHLGRYLHICCSDQRKDNPASDANTSNPEDAPEPPELPRDITYIQQETPTMLTQRQNLPDVTPTSQLPDTPNITSDIREQDVREVQIQQETQQEITNNSIPQSTDMPSYTKKSCNWWRNHV